MKRNLIFAFLLAIFLLQGTVAAIGIDAPPFPQQIGAAVQAQASGAQDESATEIADASKVSSTIEELSDYAMPGRPNASTRHGAADSASTALLFRSAFPLTAKPPPRA